jgi:RNA polymerase sigma factor (sigma-70 family)
MGFSQVTGYRTIARGPADRASCNGTARSGIVEGVARERGAAGPEATQPATAVEDVYRERRDAMLRLAYLLTGQRTVAEDVVQDAFVGLHRHWARVDNPSAYVRTSVVNGCRLHHRRRAREAAAFAELDAEQLSTETPVILDALARLPYRQRAALVLRYWDDRPEIEIAAALSCRPATVRSLVARGLAELRKVVER